MSGAPVGSDSTVGPNSTSAPTQLAAPTSTARQREEERVEGVVWKLPEMRAALREHDFAAVFRLLQRYGWSQRKIAAATRQSQSEISEIMAGRQVVSYDVLVRIADGFAVPRGWLGLAYTDDPADLTQAAASNPTASDRTICESDPEPEAGQPGGATPDARTMLLGVWVVVEPGGDRATWVAALRSAVTALAGT